MRAATSSEIQSAPHWAQTKAYSLFPEDDPFDIYPIAEPNPTGGMVSLAHIFGDFGFTGLPDDQLKANGIIPMDFGELQPVDRV